MKLDTHSQQEHWEQGLYPVGDDYYHTILNPIFKIKSWFNNLPSINAIAITPYSYLNIKSLSAKLYFIPILFRGALKNSTLLIPKKETP